jgi:hypothetical protein
MKRKRRHNGYSSAAPLEHASGAPEPMVAWVRHAIRRSVYRLLRVLIYARYSTEEQSPHSIDAQVEYGKRFLRLLGITDYELTVLQDVEMSGELRNRPGIDQVWRGIDDRSWDISVTEDASRLYRHDSWAVDLVGLAHDKGIRTFCITDMIDTAEPVEIWHRRLKDATRTHADSNWFTSHRIKRQLEYLWSIGAAIGNLRPGYRRTPTIPATETDPAEGPHFDAIDEQWAPVIRLAYKQTANDDPPWKVAEFLTEKKLPKTSNARLEEWTEENVISLIRETIYRGSDVYRETQSTSELATGKKKPRRSEPSQILTREMPHLRIVDDELWFGANAAIDARRTQQNFLSGSDHPLFGVPRDSRSLLTTLFKCGICGAPMHIGGRHGRDYVCSAAQKRKCWNRAGAEYDLIANAVKQVVRDQLISVDPVVDAFLNRLEALVGDRDALSRRIDALAGKKEQLNVRIRRLIKVIETKKNPSEKVLQRIEALEGRLRRTSGKRLQLERLLSGSMIPSREDVLRRLQTVMVDLNADPKTAGVALRKVIRRIEAVPFQQFNSTVVVLRGRIIVDLAKLLSVELASVLAELHGEGIDKEFVPTTVTVDLFRPSTAPAFGLRAEALERERDMRRTQIAETLVISERRAHIAMQYGRAMRQAGLVDPFIELTAPPAKAAHWGTHKKSRRSPKELPRPADPAAPTAAP